jgi:peroxiredoxin
MYSKNILRNYALKKGLLFISIAVTLLAGGVSCKKNNEKVKLDICIGNADKIPLILEELSFGRIDTAAIAKTNKKGCAEIGLKSFKNCFYRLRINNNDFLYLYFKENDRITITSSYPDIIYNYSISGSYDSELLKQMHIRLFTASDSINKMKEHIVSLHYMPDSYIDSLQKAYSNIANSIFTESKQYLINFIKENKESPVICMALYQYFDTSPVFTIENDSEIYDFVLESLKLYNPELEQTSLLESSISKYKLRLQQSSNQNISIKHGMLIPDFSIKNSKDKITTLSEFKGKNVILYFWASWSKQSIENLNFLKEFIEKDTEIILFSLDATSEIWKKTISGLDIGEFNNVCDFQIWESQVIKVYGIKSIPLSILIDKNGSIKIITNDMKELKKAIKEI